MNLDTWLKERSRPLGCWKDVSLYDTPQTQPCNRPAATDLGLCATHLEELQRVSA